MTGASTQTKMEAYFQTLSQHAPRATVNSHKSSISPFVSFCQTHRISLDIIDITHVKAFLTSKLASHSIQTVKGHIDSLANFLAYVWKTDPAIVKAQIYHSPDRTSTDGETTWTDIQAATPSCLDTNYSQITAVARLIDYLRHRRYGSRTHAYVELLTATAGQPSVVQQVDVDNLDLEDSTVTIRIPRSHAVSAYELLQERTVSLPSQAIDVLEVYLNHERDAAEEHDSGPLFTTPSGRVDPSTIRRAIKKVSQDSQTTPVVENETGDRATNESSDDEPDQTVTPIDIWQYSLTNGIEQ